MALVLVMSHCSNGVHMLYHLSPYWLLRRVPNEAQSVSTNILVSSTRAMSRALETATGGGAAQLAVNAYGDTQPTAAIDEGTQQEYAIQHHQNDSDAAQLAVNAASDPQHTDAIDLTQQGRFSACCVTGDTMLINIVTMTGRAYAVTVSPSAWIFDLKACLALETRLCEDVRDMRLVFENTVMDDHLTLLDYGITHGSNVALWIIDSAARAAQIVADHRASGSDSD